MRTVKPERTLRRITCQEREDLIDRLGRSYNGFSEESGIVVLSSISDLFGTYGPPRMFTEWGYPDGRVVLKDQLWRDSDRQCEHYA